MSLRSILSTTIDTEVARALENFLKSNLIKRSDLVTFAIQDYLDKHNLKQN